MKLFKPKTIWWPTWQGWALLFLILAGFSIIFFVNAHRFLAVTNRVADADILVVEDWVANKDVFLWATVQEFKKGQYRYLLYTGTNKYDDDNSSQNIRKSPVVNRPVSLGVPRDRIIEHFVPATESHRSATMARAVRDALRQNGIKSKGVNVIAPATHARKTWLVYRRAFASEVPAGIIAVLPGVYDPERWWLNSQAAKWVFTNYAGLLHEWITGL
jgi:hypothetical protein